jgi:hypothetical protein
MSSVSQKLIGRAGHLIPGLLVICTVLIFTLLGAFGRLTLPGGGSRPEESRKVQNGVWGGDHILIEVTSTGATVMFECADGTIEESLVIDGNGRFDVRGVHIRRTGGPARSDQKPERLRARYTGTVKGNSMTLTVTLPDTNETEGTYSLTYNQRPELRRCL